MSFRSPHQQPSTPPVIPYRVTWAILDTLPYADLLNFCRVNRNLSLHCRDKRYWQHRIRHVFRFNTRPSDDRSTYLQIRDCLRNPDYLEKCLQGLVGLKDLERLSHYISFISRARLEEQAEVAAYFAGLVGRPDLISRLIHTPGASPNVLNRALVGAIKGNHQALIDQLLTLKPDDPDAALEAAAEVNNRAMIDRMLQEKGKPNWGLLGAARAGNRALVDEMFNLGATWRNEALEAAAEGGHADLVNYLLSYSSPSPAGKELADPKPGRALAGAARGGHVGLFVKIMKQMSVAARDSDSPFARAYFNEAVLAAINEAARAGQIRIVLGLADNPTIRINLNPATNAAAYGGQEDLVLALIQRDEGRLLEALPEAAGGGHRRLVMKLINMTEILPPEMIFHPPTWDERDLTPEERLYNTLHAAQTRAATEGHRELAEEIRLIKDRKKKEAEEPQST